MPFFTFLRIPAVCLGFWLLGLLAFGGWLGVSAIRHAGWWMPGDRIGRYVTVSSPRVARLLISRCSGYSDKIRTNLPAFYDRYTENPYPDRFSALGIAALCTLGPAVVWFAVAWSRFLWADSGGSGVPAAGITLMAGNMLFYYISLWNHWHAKGGPTLTKAEYRAKRQAQKANRREKRRGSRGKDEDL